MPWQGYNYEDAIVISERIVREDIFTSIHVDEYSLEVRDTKRGLKNLLLIFRMLAKKQHVISMKTD